MSASMATTGSPWAARYRTNSDDSVVLPLPPLPANAIFTDPLAPFLSLPGSRQLSAHHIEMVVIFMEDDMRVIAP